MRKKINTLISFVGSNDAGKSAGGEDGAILTALKNQKFDNVILLYNDSNTKIDFLSITRYLQTEIKKRKLSSKVDLIKFPVQDVTDHNQIYVELKKFTDSLPKAGNINYTASISSGTPAMQVCWILLAESGDFSEKSKLELIKILDPKFGKTGNVPVKIDTALPKIIRLKEEVNNLKKDLIPNAVITTSRPELKIGDVRIDLSPIELSYYRYFAERVISGVGPEKFSGLTVHEHFLGRIIEIHEELFPDLDTNRIELKEMKRKQIGLSITTFRGNVSKTNKKIREALNKETLIKTFEIIVEGSRGAKFYGIKAPKEKISIKK